MSYYGSRYLRSGTSNELRVLIQLLVGWDISTPLGQLPWKARSKEEFADAATQGGLPLPGILYSINPHPDETGFGHWLRHLLR